MAVRGSDTSTNCAVHCHTWAMCSFQPVTNTHCGFTEKAVCHWVRSVRPLKSPGDWYAIPGTAAALMSRQHWTISSPYVCLAKVLWTAKQVPRERISIGMHHITVSGSAPAYVSWYWGVTASCDVCKPDAFPVYCCDMAGTRHGNCQEWLSENRVTRQCS